jgi:hypothetical protein
LSTILHIYLDDEDELSVTTNKYLGLQMHRDWIEESLEKFQASEILEH